MFGLTDLLKVINPEPVTIDHQACLPARHKRSACRACVEVCPDGALAYEDGKIQVDPAKCSRCSLCAGACPTGAIAVLGLEEAKVTSHASLRCSKAGGEGEQIPCLGWLTPDHLIGMAQQHGTVQLICGDCAACPWRRGGQMADTAVAVATAALAALGSQAAVHITKLGAGQEQPGRILSRRELFSLWTTESKQVAKTLLPEREVNHARLPARLPARRSRWVKRAAPKAVPASTAMPEGPWKAWAVTEACNGCGICAAFCPTGALTQSQDGADWTLTHQSAACVGCGTCVALCPFKAMAEVPLMADAMVAGAPQALRHLTNQRCTACRKEFKGPAGEERCPRCQTLKSIQHR